MPYCTNCGHRNPEGSNFCSNCGHRLEPAEQPSATNDPAVTGETTKVIPVPDEAGPRPKLTEEQEKAVAALSKGKGLLIVHRGPAAGSRFLLDAAENSAGRHPGSDIFLDDITVSRHHSNFRRTGDDVFAVSDNGSLNGTYVNRALIDGEVPLKTGDEVQIGKFRMMYFSGGADSD